MAPVANKQNIFARALNSRKRKDRYNEINNQPADIAEAMAEGDERSQEISERPYEVEKAMADGARRSQEVNSQAKGDSGNDINLPPPLPPVSPNAAAANQTNQQNDLGQKRQLDAEKKQSKSQLKTKIKGKSKIDQEAITGAAFSKTTGQLLKQSWLNVITSFGLTLLWIHTHALLSKVFAGKVFGPLGSEWVPQEIINKGGDELKAKIKKLGMIEWTVLILIDLIIFVTVLFIIGFLGIIVYYPTHPIQAIKDLGTVAWSLIKLFLPGID